MVPPLQCLPPAERRRTGGIVKLALAVGLEAVSQAGADAAQLAAVFTSSGGDGGLHPGRPNMRQQFEPPKPNELLMTLRSGSLRFSSR